MTDKTDINILAVSDSALMERLGSFIRHHRVQQNKSQTQLAKEAGIVRSTLSLIENGENTSLLVFIQLLRALNLLYLLQQFEIVQELTPLQLAKLEQSKKTKARKRSTESNNPESKSDW